MEEPGIKNISGNFSTRLQDGGTAAAQWLRCCATNRKVAVSIPGSFIGIFH